MLIHTVYLLDYEGLPPRYVLTVTFRETHSPLEGYDLAEAPRPAHRKASRHAYRREGRKALPFFCQASSQNLHKIFTKSPQKPRCPRARFAVGRARG